ncbi:MAG: nuclear transport factor 2 family protein [Fibrobacterota bacterium]|nr:nuclear transport factor 2 family protein [Fibrobacterota bacterium]
MNDSPAKGSLSALAQRFIEDLNSRNPEKLLHWFVEDAQLWIPPAPLVQGPKRIGLLLKLIFRRYSDIQWDIVELYQASEMIILVEMKSFGTFTSGKKYENNLISLIKYNPSGKIFYISDFFKNTAVFL